MGTMFTDIDELLDDTMEIAEEDISFKLSQVEIDLLLENTRHW